MVLQAKLIERELIGEARGRAQGKAEGKAEGEAHGKAQVIINALQRSKDIPLTANFLGYDIAYIRQIALDHGLTDLVDAPQ